MSGDPLVEQASSARLTGDFRLARRLAHAALADAADEETRRAARAEAARLRPDPLVVALTASCLALFLAIALLMR